MASIKVKFRPHSAQKEGSLYYQVIHRRLTRQISTVFRIKSSEWNGYDIIIPPDCGEARYAYLNSIKDGVRHDITRLSSIVKRYNASGEVYSTEDIVSSFHDPGTIIGFMSFAQNLIEKMKQIGKDKMAKRFSATISSLAKYTEHEDIPWQEFNSTLILGYEEFLLERGLCRNSTSYYMRNLRSIANKAAEHGFSLCPNPFKHVYMGVDKTVKRAISLKTICRIRDIDLSESPFLDFARNVFMFSFYTRGMSFVDIAFLKKSDLQNGTIRYRRRKTHQLIQVKVEAQTRKTMENMGECMSTYLLPIITDDTENIEQQYLNAYHRVNRNLKKIGELIGLETKLTMYVARHAWASIARSNNIPISTISDAMGHDSETTTRIYLSTLDTSSVDRANSKIMKLMTM